MSEFDATADEPQDQQQRIDWLRMRGVEIELPSDSKRNTVANSDIVAAAKEFVTIVKIPCDSSRPFEELRIPLEPGRYGDQLPFLLRVYFNSGTVALEQLKQQRQQQLANADVAVTQAALDRLGAEGAVEVFPLSHPNSSNNHCRVALYLDEVGQLKQLSPNHRAAALAETCGFKQVPLVGDMFVGRVGPARLRRTASTADGEGLANLDFTMREMDSDAEWLRDIERLNYEHGVATGSVAMPGDASAAAAAADDGDLLEGQEGPKGLRWSETAEYLEISIHIPDAIERFTARDITVKYEAQRVLVHVKNTSSGALPDTAGGEVAAGERLQLWDGKLHGGISVDDCTWCINGHDIELTLEKSVAGRWGKLER